MTIHQTVFVLALLKRAIVSSLWASVGSGMHKLTR